MHTPGRRISVLLLLSAFLAGGVCCPVQAQEAVNAGGVRALSAGELSKKKDMLSVIASWGPVAEYQDKPVSRETLMELLTVVEKTPSAFYQRPWEFVVVSDKKMLEWLSSLRETPIISQASFVLVMVVNLNTLPQKGRRNYWIQDCSMAAQDLLLGAEALGLQTEWVRLYPWQGAVQGAWSALGLPDHVIPFGMISVGYGSQNKTQAPLGDVLSAPVAKNFSAPASLDRLAGEYQVQDALTVLYNRQAGAKSFKEPLTQDELAVLLSAGMSAHATTWRPTAFLVITDQVLLKKMIKAGNFPNPNFADNASVVVVLGDVSKIPMERYKSFWPQFCGAAVEAMRLAADALGVGSNLYRIYPDETAIKNLRALLKLPKEVIPFNIVVAGHAERLSPALPVPNALRIHWEKY